jgi:hypothetical protein
LAHPSFCGGREEWPAFRIWLLEGHLGTARKLLKVALGPLRRLTLHPGALSIACPPKRRNWLSKMAFRVSCKINAWQVGCERGMCHWQCDSALHGGVENGDTPTNFPKTAGTLPSFESGHTYPCVYRNTHRRKTPPPADYCHYVRNAGQEQPLLNYYAAAVLPRISHRESGTFSSKTKPKLTLTSSRIWRVQVTRPRIAYRRSGCRMTPTASPGTTFFRELNLPPVSERSKTFAGWRVFSSDDSVSNVEQRGKRPFTF